MGFNAVDKTTPSQGQSVDTFGSAQVKLYDQYGAPYPSSSFDVAERADRETFGAVVTGSRIAVLLANWSLAVAANQVTTTATNSGSTSQANGQLQIISGVNISGTSQVQTKQTIQYLPGREIYCHFTAAYTTPTSSASEQRAGLYDANNGFFIGYHGLNFGISSRVAGSDTFIAQASFNVDTLTGAVTSQFTSGGTPQAINPVNQNVFRIRFGWLGSATITFQVMAPDGNWVTFHRYRAPNSQVAPFIQNPNLPITMEVIKNVADIVSLVVSTSSWDAGVVATPGALNQEGSHFPNNVVGVPVLGMNKNSIVRVQRVDEVGTLRTSRDLLLWHDAFEGSTINAFWTQSLTTMTAVQATGILTLNNGSITTLSTNAIITSQRQFAKYPRSGLICRFRANITANVASNHTLVEMGLGAPSGVTAIISNGAFFRWTAAGNLVAVVSYNGTETVSATLVAQGATQFSTASYCDYTVELDEDYARFIVSDSQGVPIVDTMLTHPAADAYVSSTSHIPSFARVYVDATGGGTAIQLKLAAHSVQMIDADHEMPTEHQQSLSMRQASINPTTYAQTPQLAAGTAPGTVTPSNTATPYTTLGGEYAVALVASGENLLGVFGFQIPNPYTFMLRGIAFSIPAVTTAISMAAIPVLEWFLITNCTSANIATGGGFRQTIPVMYSYTSATQAAGTLLNGQPVNWIPQTPIICLPGTFIQIGYKELTGGAVTTAGVTRGTVTVDGYYL